MKRNLPGKITVTIVVLGAGGVQIRDPVRKGKLWFVTTPVKRETRGLARERDDSWLSAGTSVTTYPEASRDNLQFLPLGGSRSLVHAQRALAVKAHVLPELLTVLSDFCWRNSRCKQSLAEQIVSTSLSLCLSLSLSVSLCLSVSLSLSLSLSLSVSLSHFLYPLPKPPWM